MTCDECDERVNDIAHLKCHIISNHSEKEPKCDNCLNSSNLKANLEPKAFCQSTEKENEVLLKEKEELKFENANKCQDL